MYMNAEDRYSFWENWEQRLKELWWDLENDKCGKFESRNITIPYDIEQPIMEELFKMALKMHELVSERLRIADKVDSFVYAHKERLLDSLGIDIDTLDYRFLQEVVNYD